MSRLRALTLRREDSSLQAFSEFAVLSCFVPITRKTGTSIPPIEARFITVYFAPIWFGFTLCLLTFTLFAAKSSAAADLLGLSHHSHFIREDKFAFMLCVLFGLSKERSMPSARSTGISSPFSIIIFNGNAFPNR